MNAAEATPDPDETRPRGFLTMMGRLARLYTNRQFIIFLVIGGTAAGVNFIARIALSLLINYPLAVSLAYVVGMLVAFPLNRMFVFPNSTKSIVHNAVFFVLVNLMTFPMVLAISWILGELIFPMFMTLPHAETVGHAIGLMAPAFSSFVLHKHLTFRSVKGQ